MTRLEEEYAVVEHFRDFCYPAGEICVEVVCRLLGFLQRTRKTSRGPGITHRPNGRRSSWLGPSDAGAAFWSDADSPTPPCSSLAERVAGPGGVKQGVAAIRSACYVSQTSGQATSWLTLWSFRHLYVDNILTTTVEERKLWDWGLGCSKLPIHQVSTGPPLGAGARWALLHKRTARSLSSKIRGSEGCVQMHAGQGPLVKHSRQWLGDRPQAYLTLYPSSQASCFRRKLYKA